MKYIPTIGLEIHAELNTETKMFCSCKNDPDESRPNFNICPICMGHPGTLPVVNYNALRHVLMVGIAIDGQIAKFTEFDRKNYFYPDIPKAYQISQYKYPLISGGNLKGVKITRVHLEEDTASSSHDGEYSKVDFNRAGVPLMELVTEPVIHTAEEVMSFGEELQLLLQYLGVSNANMEKGEMRLEVNISLSEYDDPKKGPLGTKVEIKNINSFKAAGKAIEYEIKRQSDILEKGEKVSQETRGYDEKSQTTFSQRSKEDSHDYRYFPDPDIPKFNLSIIKELDKDYLSSIIKETPEKKRDRYKNDYGIKSEDIEFYVRNKGLSVLFENSAQNILDKNYQILSNFIVSDIASIYKEDVSVDPLNLTKLVNLFIGSKISSRGMKDIFSTMLNKNEDPEIIAKEKNLFQNSDKSTLLLMINSIIEQNNPVVLEYKNGKMSALQYLVGQAMKESKGSANPQLLKSLFEEILKN